jgi:hypothetical protein
LRKESRVLEKLFIASGFGVETIHPNQFGERSSQVSHCASTISCFRHLGAEFGSGEVDFPWRASSFSLGTLLRGWAHLTACGQSIVAWVSYLIYLSKWGMHF